MRIIIALMLTLSFKIQANVDPGPSNRNPGAGVASEGAVNCPACLSQTLGACNRDLQGKRCPSNVGNAQMLATKPSINDSATDKKRPEDGP